MANPFAHVTGTNSSITSSATSGVFKFASAPVAGDVVCFAITGPVAVGSATPSAADSAGNSYTAAGTSSGSGGVVSLLYLLNAPSNATATVTLTWSASAEPNIFGDIFTVTGGTTSFGTFTSSAGGTSTTSGIATPSIPAATGTNLLYSGAHVSTGTITNVSGSWTINAGAGATVGAAEWEANVTANTTVEYVVSTATFSWTDAGMAIRFVPTSIVHLLSCLGAGT